MTKVSRVWAVSLACACACACALLLSGGALCGCSDEVEPKAQMRRDVLRANNLAADRRKLFDEIRVLDDNGNLLPSKQRVAGVLLPRGYEPKFKFDYEWYFDGEQPYSKLAKYFTEQLEFSTVQRPNGATLTFVQARSKGDSEMKSVSLTISPVPGRDDWSRIRIVAQQPMPEHLQSRAEIEAELSMRRENLR